MMTSMEDPPTPCREGPAALAAIPGSCAMGLSGWVRLRLLRESPIPPILPISPTTPSEETWQAPGFAVAIRGQHDYCASPEGWHVFVLGQARCAEAIAQVLAAFPSAIDDLSPEQARALSWSTLPSAAIVAVHPQEGHAFLMRDSAGFRPLYYCFQDDLLLFSSNLPHLRATSAATGINTDKVVEMLTFGHRSGGRTLWQGVNVVGPGRLVEFTAARPPRQQQFWRADLLLDLDERERLRRLSLDDTLKEIGEVLDESLAPLQNSEVLAVPCGGGVDSSLLGAYLKRKRAGLTFFTVNKTDAARQERVWMDALSARLQIPCEYVNVSRANFLAAYFQFLVSAEQPAIGPNLVAHHLLRQQALERGYRQFVTGELCDTVFGGLSTFYYLSRRFRLLRWLTRLPAALRFWLPRAMAGEKSLLLQIMQTARGEDMGRIAGGDLERAEYMTEAGAIPRQGQSAPQHMADLLTWMNLRLIPSALHSAFFEYDEQPGGVTHFPFAHPRMLRLGLHLPHSWKRRSGANKWIWRRFAEPYIGRDVAFRRKDTFPAPIHAWLDKAVDLLPGGFLEDLFCTKLGGLLDGMPPDDPSRWSLVNLELWGRLHCRHEDGSRLLERVL
jgi:asparagine synthetase B (glutamine-hydrolysing)